MHEIKQLTILRKCNFNISGKQTQNLILEQQFRNQFLQLRVTITITDYENNIAASCTCEREREREFRRASDTKFDILAVLIGYETQKPNVKIRREI